MKGSMTVSSIRQQEQDVKDKFKLKFFNGCFPNTEASASDESPVQDEDDRKESKDSENDEQFDFDDHY